MAGKTIRIAIVANAAKAKAEMDSLGKKSQGLGTKLAKVGKYAAVGGAAAAAGMAVVGRSLVEAGETAGTSNAKIEQILKSMGQFPGASDKVAAGLIKQAEAMALKTGIDQNQIKQAQATLATFDQVGKSAGQMGGTFERATQISADLSAAGLASVESASVMLGKALNDPVKGITAMTRVGVSFTEQQQDQIKAMVKAGNTAGAQEVILKALEKQVGGVAAATANSTDQMKVKWSQVKEAAGLKLQAALAAVADVMVNRVFPAVEQAGQAIGRFVTEHRPQIDQFKAAVVAFGGFVMDVLPVAFAAAKDAVAALFAVLSNPVVQVLTAGVLAAVAAFKAYQAVVMVVSAVTKAYAAVQAALNVVMMANPIGLVILAIVALVAMIVVAYKKSETFRNIVNGLWGTIKRVFSAIPQIVGTVVKGLIAWYTWLPRKAIAVFSSAGSWLKDAGSRLVSGFKSGISGAWGRFTGWIRAQINKIPAAVRKVLGIASPSRVFAEIGAQSAAGIEMGFASRLRKVQGTVRVGTSSLAGAAAGSRSGSRDVAAASVGDPVLRTIIRELQKASRVDAGVGIS